MGAGILAKGVGADTGTSTEEQVALRPLDDSSGRITSSEVDRILLVSDDPLARTGLALLLSNVASNEIAVVAQLASDDDLGAAVRESHPSAALWDVGLARGLGDRSLEIDRVVVPAVLLLPDDLLAADALSQGARGVLFRDADGLAIASALRAVARGLTVVDPAIAASVLPSRERPTLLREPLTARENEVLKLLTAGLANKVIAQRLGISEHTVKFHVNAILAKLGAESRTDAVVRAARMGLVIL